MREVSGGGNTGEGMRQAVKLGAVGSWFGKGECLALMWVMGMEVKGTGGRQPWCRHGSHQGAVSGVVVGRAGMPDSSCEFGRLGSKSGLCNLDSSWACKSGPRH
ncbi:hypothetical protein V6N13_036766 [Hibiscus sabdariffa]